MLVDNTQLKKVIKDNFLNLLCALSCVVFSADCSAIVFLYVNFKVAFKVKPWRDCGCQVTTKRSLPLAGTRGKWATTTVQQQKPISMALNRGNGNWSNFCILLQTIFISDLSFTESQTMVKPNKRKLNDTTSRAWITAWSQPNKSLRLLSTWTKLQVRALNLEWAEESPTDYIKRWGYSMGERRLQITHQRIIRLTNLGEKPFRQ